MKSKTRKEFEKRREEILYSLPGFINQLLLLLQSGMVLQDAFEQIAEEYEKLRPQESTYFTREISLMQRRALQNGENVMVKFQNFSRQSNVKELSRIANILIENQNKGTDLWDKLAEQGESLWAERKRIALNKIRIAESKMSFPLGIFLLSLIIMTAAPAMLQMK